MKRIVLEVHDAFAVFGLKIRLMDNISLRHFPRPDGSQRRVGLDGVVGWVGHVRADDFQRLVMVVGSEGAVQRKKFREDGCEGGVGFHIIDSAG